MASSDVNPLSMSSVPLIAAFDEIETTGASKATSLDIGYIMTIWSALSMYRLEGGGMSGIHK